MKIKHRRFIPVFLSVLLVLTSICAGLSVSAVENDRITYKYIIDCNDEINAFDGEVTFPDNLTPDEENISFIIAGENDGIPEYSVKNNKILFNATVVDMNNEKYYDFSGGVALITVDFIVSGEYDMNDIQTTLSEFYSVENAQSGTNIPFSYQNTVNDEVISSGYMDLDNPSYSYSDPVVTFDYGYGNLTETIIVEHGDTVSQPDNPTREDYDFVGWYLGNNEYNFNNSVTEDITLAAKWKKTPKLYSANTVSLEENLRFNFFAVLDDEDVDGAYVKFEYTQKDSGGEHNINETVAVDSNNILQAGLYRVPCQLTASQMAVTVTASLYLKNSETPVDTFSRSIRDYCIAGFGLNNISAIEKDLYRATLNYGGFAQDFFGYNTDLYANKDYENDDISDVTVTSSVTNEIPKGVTSNGITYSGATLTLVDKPFIRYYFKVESGSNIGDYKFNLDGKAMTPEQSGSYYYIESAPIVAADLDEAQTVIVRKGSTATFNFMYSAVKWMESASTDNDNEKEVNLAKAMYNYYLAATEFISSKQ